MVGLQHPREAEVTVCAAGLCRDAPGPQQWLRGGEVLDCTWQLDLIIQNKFLTPGRRQRGEGRVGGL